MEGATVLLPGFTSREARFAALMLSEVFAVTAPEVAVIVTVPRFKPVARPLTVMDAVLFPEEVQVTVLVMF